MSGPIRKLVVTLALFALVVPLGAGFAAGVEDADASWAGEALATNYEGQVGERVHLWARVRTVDPLVVDLGETTVTVVDAEIAAAPGDVIQVYGTVEPDRRIAAERLVVSDRTDRTRMFAVSLLAPLVALGIAWRRWTVRSTDWSLVPRDA